MPKHCRIFDPLSPLPAEKPFGTGGNGSPIFECIRILMGTVDVENKTTGKVTKLRRCHLTQSNRRLSSRTIDQIILKLFEGDLDRKVMGVYLSKSINDNRDFWESVKAELCLCLVAWRENKNLNAFLYLFRTLELISVALPLVYASSGPDYQKALTQLKSLSQNPRDADLAIFKNFISHIAKIGDYKLLDFEFEYTRLGEQWVNQFENQLRSYVFVSPVKGEFKTEGTGFDIGFEMMPSFVAVFRNRLFHQRQSENHFRLDELDGAEDICATVLPPALYWLSLVLVEILKVHAKRYV